MDKKEAIQFLKQSLSEIPHLAKLRHDNQDYPLWHRVIEGILEEVFGRDSSEYQNFFEAWPHASYLGENYQNRYLAELKMRETALLSIIQKHEILGTETKPAAKELELILEGTPDMIIECVRSTIEKLNYEGQSYSFRRTSGAPDYARWDKTYFASCAISESERQIGVIKLQFLPEDKTLLKYHEPEDWHSSFGKFLNRLLSEFKELRFLDLKEEKPTAASELPPKAFISHGKESVALKKLEEFLRVLGVEPLIVKEQPSLDKDLPDKVNLYLSQADFVIILATADDKVGDKLQPRQNVIHEIGLAQKTHSGRIIYLLEEGAEFPSNIRPKVWERFKQRNMLNAFLCILRELRAYGILKVMKP